MGYDQWKTASPYDDADDTRCWHCGALLPEKADEVKLPWIFDGYCSYECSQDRKDIPCSRELWNLLLFHWGAKDLDDLSKKVKEETGKPIRWIEFDIIRIGEYTLNWPESSDVVLDWFNSVTDS